MVTRFRLLLITILVVILTLWALFSGAGGSGYPVKQEGDLDGDGIKEEYVLVDNCITVNEGGQSCWQSPTDWRVDGFTLGDADNDGTVNLVISLWKTGSFGSSKPFWHQGEDTSYKNHLFVLKMVADTLKPVWCSSNLDCPIVSFTVNDINDDGLNEVVVEEGKYRRVFGQRYAQDEDAPVRTTVWQWDQWGFKLLSR